MAEVKRAISSRRGYHTHLKKLLQSVEECLSTTTTSPLTTDQIATLRDLHEQLTRKDSLIAALDTKILEALENDEEIEAEIVQTEEITSLISTAKAKITHRLTPTSAEAAAARHEETLPATHSPPAPPECPIREPVSLTRLPKLDLPHFSGNPLFWQAFWDSFEAAVHSNTALTGVQKLSYLRAQLKGDASKVIAGFQLTNANYTHSVALLQERFGQSYKQIDAHMQALINLPTPSQSYTSLREFHDTIESHIRSLASLGKTEDSYGSLLVSIIFGKLPGKVKQNLARAHGKREWTVTELQAAVLNELYILEMGSQVEEKLPPTAAFVAGTSKPIVKSKAQCPFCKGPHAPSLCTTITDPKQRTDIIRQDRLCFNCLGHHKISSCNSKHRCHHCCRKHHTSLCSLGDQSNYTVNPPSTPINTVRQQNNSTTQPVQLQPAGVHSVTSTPSQSTGVCPTSSAQHQPVSQLQPATQFTQLQPTAQPTGTYSVTLPPQHSNACLLKTAVARVTSRNRCVEANILLDEGSQRSFVTEELASILDLQPYSKELLTISSFGTKHPVSHHLNVSRVTLLTRSGEELELSVLVVPFIATPLQNCTSLDFSELPHLQGLQLAHPLISDSEFAISLLIGADFYWDIVGDKIIRGSGPTAVESKLGYLLSGPTHQGHPYSMATNVSMIATPTQGDFDLERFWTLESIGISQATDGAYVARFPWRTHHPPLPSNYTVAERRTRQLAKRLATQPKLLQLYHQIIADQEARDFIERVDTSSEYADTHYIPHHAVEKDSPTTPIRIVFDCSCRQSASHPSLNDCLEIGVPCSNDLCSILIRFRVHQFGFSGDIEKAFLNIRLHPDNRDYTRFFWLSNPADPSSQFHIYRFKVVPFGATSSPFILNAVLQHHLKQHNTAVSRDMQISLYVDNIITGCDTEDAAVDYYKQARAIMCSGMFNLRSWSSNSNKLMTNAVQDKTADDHNTVNVLGLQWDPTNDLLSLVAKPFLLTNNHLITKRQVLQAASKIFDPFGFISPVVVRAKILIQKLWQLKVTWDEPLNDDLQAEWKNVATDLNVAHLFSVSRRYFAIHIDHPSIHCFVDASQQAYGAIVFLVQGKQVSFVLAKTRVAPLKTLTIPRLELMAALVATRLTNFVLEAIPTCDPSIFVWSDSQIVLHWVSSQKPLPTFVNRRITEMKSLLPNATWKYCPTAENPADLLSRGTTIDALMSSSLWNHGPKWLPDPSEWPSPQLLPIPPLVLAAAVETEFVPSKPTLPDTGLHCVISIKRYSTLRKLLAVTAYVIRFTDSLRAPADQRRIGPISAEEYAMARLRWLKDTQQSVYDKEIDNLQQLTRRSKTPRLLLVRQLRLLIDAKGFLRCGGRIHNAPLSDLTKFPYLLPAKHPFSRLIIWDIHRDLYHSGTNATLTALRQTYWIPAARQYIKSALRTCVICRRVSGKPYPTPDPAPLPSIRTQNVRPFTYSGVDFSGALYVRHRGEELKVYLCLFTCATSRALHLEIVQDLSTETFLLAFRKFAARLSLPTMMISDNASTYLSAADELKALMQSPEVKRELGKRGVSWKFIPKKAPWWGGFWERMVGLTKSALKKVLGRRHISLTTLETVIVEIEAALNDRPLTFVSSEQGDIEPLTPAHLLHGRRITCLPHEVVEEDEFTDPTYGEVCGNAKLLATILQNFQKRWRHEYLTSLREVHRATGSNSQTVRTGDVVLIHDDTPRATWKMGIVEDLMTGGDGIVRAVTLRTASGLTNRPVTKLYPLELTVTTQPEFEQSKIHQTEKVDATTAKSSDLATLDCTTPMGLSTSTRPQRLAARKATVKMKKWTRTLACCPPEDVATPEH
ncbi:uncharacterized protein [Dysidea avara]|uniref:uncharacterized protein n=1 Tax=Dysidea avara TaxID=196820 RepID=UPI00331E32CD